MPKLCPECKNPPRYHSFCTRCAKLFRPPRRKWDYFQKIRHARNELLTQKEAAKKIGISVTMLEKYRKQFNIPPFPRARPKRDIPQLWTPARVRDLRCMIVARCSPEEAAQALGRSIRSIYEARKRYDLPKFPHRNNAPPPIWTDDRIARLKFLRASGASFSEIAPEFSVTRDAIAGAVHRYLHEARP
jgi:transposase